MTTRNYLKYFFVCFLILVISLAISPSIQAGVQVTKKPNSSYDMKGIKNISVPEITSNNVDFGKVAKDRLPKIKAILEKTKTILRRNLVDGSKQSNATIDFQYNASNASISNAILKVNLDEFDNGNQAARLLPFAGKAKVTMSWQLLDSRTKEIITEFKTQIKNKDGLSGVTGAIGGTDSDVLLLAANEANGQLYKHLAKLIGFKYSLFSHLGEKVKNQTKDTGNVLKEEKRELQKK